MTTIIILYILVFAATFLGVGEFRRWSVKRRLLDIPNERSSHSAPTPRGGGVIIFVVAIIAFYIQAVLSGQSFYWSYFLGASIIVAISLLDDVKGVSPIIRFLFHGSAAALMVWSSGGFDNLCVPFYGVLQLGAWGKALAFFWIVWLINAYNFMDGIDGIAAGQAITAGVGWCVLGYSLGLSSVGFYGGVLLFSSIGFAMHNWPPAKIFMGDVGSAFLGYTFAVMPLLALNGLKANYDGRTSGILPWFAVLFVWFFVFDSVFTLLKRLLRGEKVWRAHREHIYQKLVIAGLTHGAVSGLYCLLSGILVFTALIGMRWFPLDLENPIMAALSIETLMLLVFWRITVRERKKNVYG